MATTKRWVDANGKQHGGLPFVKNTLGQLLGNVVYLGKVRHKDEFHEGQHPAIVDANLWRDVHEVLDRNHRTAGAFQRNRYGALLKGLLRCKPCDAAMVHSPVSTNHRQYRYYVCTNAQKIGYEHCPCPSLRAASIEQSVLERLRAIPFNNTKLRGSPIAAAVGALLERPAETIPSELAASVRVLVESVEHDARAGRIGLTLTPEAADCLSPRAGA